MEKQEQERLLIKGRILIFWRGKQKGFHQEIQLIPGAAGKDRLFIREADFFQDGSGQGAVKAYPKISPGILVICLIPGGAAGTDEKALPGLQRIGGLVGLKNTFP